MSLPDTKPKRQRGRKVWPYPDDPRFVVMPPATYGSGRTLAGREFEKRKAELEAEDREKRRAK